MTVAELIEASGGVPAAGVAAGAALVGQVVTDSRTTSPGDVFVGLKGESYDGNDFIDDAVSRGATMVVCGQGRSLERRGVVFVEVTDTLAALGAIAARHRRSFAGPVVAITGSNGKTTSKEMLKSVLEEAYGSGRVSANQGNFNNLVGMPLSLLKVDGRHRAAILEMGMNAPGEIARLVEIAAPTHGLVTCVAPAHLDGLGSLEGVAQAKGELFAGLPANATAVVNRDDEHVLAQSARFSGRKVFFGLQGSVRAENIESGDLRHVAFELVHEQEKTKVVLATGGRHNVGNALGAAAVALELGVPLAAVARGLAKAPAVPMRLAVEVLGNGVIIVNDAYNANPASLQAAIETIGDRPGGRCLLVLGDMLELGDDAALWHARAGRAAASLQPVLLCAMGPHARDLCGGALEAGLSEDSVAVVSDHSGAANAVAALWKRGDTVLVKGSRGAGMERVVELLKEEALR